MPEVRIGDRIRQIRERQGISQETLAGWLGVSRAILAQVESGVRNPGIALLENLAYRLGCDLRSLASGDSRIDPVQVLFRADPKLIENTEAMGSIQKCIRISKETSRLEEILGVDRASSGSARFPTPAPRSRMEAVRQGERAAESERRRLRLGVEPIQNMVSLLEGEGIVTAQVSLAADISGISFLGDPWIFIFINLSHRAARKRFSFAHEYAHAILDLQEDSRVVISLDSEAGQLREVRANAFAAAFLAPEESCRQFLISSGKGRSSRIEYAAFGGSDPVGAYERNAAHEQAVQPHDILNLARHFGVSPETAAFRLGNIRLLDEKDRDRFLEDYRSGSLAGLKRLIPDPEWSEEREDYSFTSRMLGLALEARRRGEITTGRLIEIADLVDIDRSAVEEALAAIGRDE